MDAKLALATIWGRAYAADPPKKEVLHSVGFRRFWGSGVWKKDAKIPRSILDTFWRCFIVFLLLAKRENTVIYNVFVPLA